jgi:hypothetical protein
MRTHTEGVEAIFVAAKPRWWNRIPDICVALAESERPVIDRSAVETLFGLRRRQAINVLIRFGAYQLGRTFLIGREQLIERLAALHAGDDCQFEVARRERVSAEIAKIQRTRRSEGVRIPVTQDVFSASMRTLSPDVQLRPGKLNVEFAGPEDLLRKLFCLSQCVANDYAHFERAATGGDGLGG